MSTVHLPKFYLITDRRITCLALLDVIEASLKAGVKLIQLREKDLSSSELRVLAAKVLKLTRVYGARLLLNGAIELAVDIKADGIQLGVHSESISNARRDLGRHALIGYSAHSVREVEDAAAQGADFATFGPVYFTASKAQYGPPQGLHALCGLCRKAPIPVYAIGGISADRINEVINAGAYGVALISAVMAAENPQKAAQSILHKISDDCAKLRNNRPSTGI